MMNLKYTVLTTMGDHDVREDIHHMYKHIPSLVRILIVNPDGSFDCLDMPSCVYHPVSNPEGIPPWKLFSFSYWAGGYNPLGAQWTVSPEPYSLMYGDRKSVV